MKHIKLIFFSTLILVLFIPTFFSSYITINYFFNKNFFTNTEYIASDFYTSDDEIGFYTDWCIKNSFGGRTIGTDEEKLANCIDAELRLTMLSSIVLHFSQISTLILLPIFLIIFYFYFRWFRRNYFNKTITH